MTEQGYPPRQSGRTSHFGHGGNQGRPGRPRTAQDSRDNGWQMLGGFERGSDLDSDLPPWAIPGGVQPVRPARRPARTVEAEPLAPPHQTGAEEPRRSEHGDGGRRPGRSRAAATRRRRSRRRLTTWGSVAAVAAVIAVATYYLLEPSAPPRQYVTALQKGEFRDVPNACRVIAPSTLRQYLAGTPGKAVPTFAAATKSQCTFSVDSKPVFRELDISYEAYTPSLIAPGNGSATSYARYTFALTRLLLARPPKNAQEPPAALTPLPGLGSQAVAGVQLYRQRSKTDLVTVLVRVRNVLITVKLWASVGPGFTSVSIPQLRQYAQAAASTSVAAVSREPAAGA